MMCHDYNNPSPTQTGVGDSVRCYHCGGGLRNWEEGDSPMKEHAKWYPTCQHVMIVKGKQYIQRVEQGQDPEMDCHVEQVRPSLCGALELSPWTLNFNDRDIIHYIYGDINITFIET